LQQITETDSSDTETKAKQSKARVLAGWLVLLWIAVDDE
jgi:hypothetical protein